jgi:acyl carrier protein
MRQRLSERAVFRIQIWEKLTVLDRPASSAAAAGRIAALVQKILAKRGIEYTVAPNADLADSGLSSLDMVNLMLAVEAEFGLKIPDADMTPANFRSVARIGALVERVTGE